MPCTAECAVRKQSFATQINTAGVSKCWPETCVWAAVGDRVETLGDRAALLVDGTDFLIGDSAFNISCVGSIT